MKRSFKLGKSGDKGTNITKNSSKTLAILESIAQMKYASVKHIYKLHYQGKSLRACQERLKTLSERQNGYLLIMEASNKLKNENNRVMLSTKGIEKLNEIWGTEYPLLNDKDRYIAVNHLVHGDLIRDIYTNIKCQFRNADIFIENDLEFEGFNLRPDLNVWLDEKKLFFVEVDWKMSLNREFKEKFAKYKRILRVDNEDIKLMFVTYTRPNLRYVLGLKNPNIYCVYRPNLNVDTFFMETKWLVSG